MSVHLKNSIQFAQISVLRKKCAVDKQISNFNDQCRDLYTSRVKFSQYCKKCNINGHVCAERQLKNEAKPLHIYTNKSNLLLINYPFSNF